MVQVLEGQVPPWAKDKQLSLSEALSGAWWVTLANLALEKRRQGLRSSSATVDLRTRYLHAQAPGVTAGKGQVTETGSRVEPGPSVFLHDFSESPPQPPQVANPLTEGQVPPLCF